MFRKLINELTWYSQFDREFRFAKEYRVNKIMCKRLEEKVLYWRNYGKKFKKSPEESIKHAVLEYCDEFYLANKDKRHCQNEFYEMACALKNLELPTMGPNGMVQAEEHLPKLWQSFLKNEND